MSERKPIDVHILVTVPKPEYFDACTLVFDSIRTGFPTAKIYVYYNCPSIEGPDVSYYRLHDRLVDQPDIFLHTVYRAHHAKWIADVTATHSNPDHQCVILDADVVLWKSVEDWDWSDKLIAGYYVPRMWNDFAKCVSMPRLHTSFLWIPDPVALMTALRQAYMPSTQEHGEYCPCDPFMPRVMFDHGKPVFWDSTANLFAMLPWRCGIFEEWHKEHYDHLNSASFFDVMLDRLDGDKEMFAYLHRFAKGEQLKNLWPMVDHYYARKAEQAERL